MRGNLNQIVPDEDPLRLVPNELRALESCTMTLGELQRKASEINPKKVSEFEDMWSYSDMTAREFVQGL